MLRVGRIEYANVDPLYRLLPRRGIALVSGTPAELNRRMERGRLDLSFVSTAAYARNAAVWRLLPGLSVSADGPVGSVLLCEAGRPLSAAPVAVPRASETGTLLLRLLAGMRGEAPPAVRLAARTPRSGRFLLIGDPALRFRCRPPRGARVVLDLAAEWRRLTGTPCVFAVCAVRAEACRRRAAAVREAAAAIRASARLSRHDMGPVARAAARRLHLPVASVRRYLQGISYALGRREIYGLARLLIETALATASLPVPAIRFAEAA